MKKLKNSELNRISSEEFKSSTKTPIKVLLDNIRSAHNVGTHLSILALTLLALDPKHAELRPRQVGACDACGVVRARLSAGTTALACRLVIVGSLARVSACDATLASFAHRPGKAC